MTRTTLKSLGAALALVIALCATVLPSAAHGLSSPAIAHPTQLNTTRTLVPIQGPSCRTVRVHLRGNQPPIATCAERPHSTINASGPLTWEDLFCDGTDVHLYTDASYAGYLICFYGNGFVNMTDFTYVDWFGIERSWNDTVTSWKAKSWFGRFYSDINGAGAYKLYFNALQQGNFINDTLPNDTLSSMCLDGFNSHQCP
jgi:hypothetical protein